MAGPRVTANPSCGYAPPKTLPVTLLVAAFSTRPTDEVHFCYARRRPRAVRRGRRERAGGAGASRLGRFLEPALWADAPNSRRSQGESTRGYGYSGGCRRL